MGRGEKEEKEEGGWQCFALVENGGGVIHHYFVKHTIPHYIMGENRLHPHAPKSGEAGEEAGSPVVCREPSRVGNHGRHKWRI